jgi:23S rRNA (uracil1939-C5)-methyltransferase
MKPNRPQDRKTEPHAIPSVATETRVLNIEKPIYGGAFLAHDAGKAIFVPLTLPGEQARVRMVEDKRGYASAEVEEILTASPERVAPGCRHFGLCGGCQYQHASYATQLELKQAVLRETLERGGVAAPAELTVLAGEPWGYRNRIRLAFDAAGNPGYRGRRSHAVIPITECPIAAPLLVDAALAIAEVVRQFANAPKPTEIALFCNANETELLASIFTSSAKKVRFDQFAQAVAERVPPLTGAELFLEAHQKSQPSRTIAQWGASSLTYRAASVDYRVDHGAFFQVNRWLVDSLVERVTASRTGGLAWDLFAGVGLFARQLTTAFNRIVAVESAPSAIPALAANLKGTRGAPVRAATLDFLARNQDGDRPDLIVVDPPRTGLGAEITALLARIAAPAITYVSCDPATLSRDLRALLAAGYAVESLALADLFPQTFHLETVTRLIKS